MEGFSSPSVSDVYKICSFSSCFFLDFFLVVLLHFAEKKSLYSFALRAKYQLMRNHKPCGSFTVYRRLIMTYGFGD